MHVIQTTTQRCTSTTNQTNQPNQLTNQPNQSTKPLRDSDKTRAAEEVFRLTQELASSQTQLEVKNFELSNALSTFTEQQKKTELNAQAHAVAGLGSQEREKELEKEKSELLHNMSDLKAKVQISEAELGTLRESSSSTKKALEEAASERDELKSNQVVCNLQILSIA